MKTLYISDMDGTLLNMQGIISEYSRNALSSLLEHGLHFTVATGRTPLTALKLLEGFPLSYPLLLLNGALILEPSGERILDSKSIDPASLNEIGHLEQALGIRGLYICNHENRVECSLDDSSCCWDNFFQKNQITPESLSLKRMSLMNIPDDILYFMYMDQRPDKLEQMYLALSHNTNLVLDYYQDIYLPNTWFLEIHSAMASKGEALRTLRQWYKIDQIVAFGDSTNDIPLFEEADIRCAVSNGRPALKQLADQIIQSNEDDGVARYLQQIWEKRGTL